MSLSVLLIVLGAMIGLRIAFLATQFADLESFWYDLGRNGIRFQIARAISVVTNLIFLGCAGYALWKIEAVTGFWPRCGVAFAAWFGLSLLTRFPPHKFPRTNSPQLYSEAQMNLVINLVMSVLSGVGMTALTALYFWWRG
jgi:hypothetical protein